MKTEHQKRIEEFMGKAKQEVPKNPCIPSEKVRLLRARLIMEESLEAIDGLGFTTEVAIDSSNQTHRTPIFIQHDRGPNLEQIVDGCADLSVVSIGTLSACGVHDDPILQEVDRTNLMKFTGDSHLGEDGKWIKPSDWKPPNILGTLAQQGIAKGANDTASIIEELTPELQRAKDDGVKYDHYKFEDVEGDYTDAENQEEG